MALIKNSGETEHDDGVVSVPDSYDKWRWSVFIGLLFILVANPYSYRLTQNVLGSAVNIANFNAPAPTGIIIHCIIFILLVRLLMNYKV